MTCVSINSPAMGYRLKQAALSEAVAESLESRQLLATTVSFLVYVDANRNGTRDAGEGTAPVRSDIYIYQDANGDGIRQTAEPAIFPTSTVSLSAGTYDFRMVLNGYRQSDPAANGAVTLIASGSGTATVTFGVYPLTTQLTGRLYYDADGDSAFDPVIDVGLPGRTVYFDANNNGQQATGSTEPSAVTNADGTYTLNVPTATPLTAPVRVVTPLTLAAPATGAQPVSLNPDSPATIGGLDFSVVAPSAGSRMVAVGTSLIVFGTPSDDALTLSRDATTGDVVVQQNGETRTFSSSANFTIEWFAAGGRDVLVDNASGVSATVLDAGPVGVMTLNGTAGNDVLFVAHYSAGTTFQTNGRTAILNWVSATQHLPSLEAFLGAGRDSVQANGGTFNASTTSGYATLAANGEGDDDAFDVRFAGATLRGGDGNDRFYIRDAVSQTIDGGPGTDAAATDAADVLTSIEQGATAQLSGGNFTDEDLDGLLPGATARGWVNACQSISYIARSDRLPADPAWTVADANPLGGFDLTGLLPGTYVITGTITGIGSADFYVTSGDGTSLSVTLADGEINRSANLGWAKIANIAVNPFLDINSDGKLTGEDQVIPDRVIWIDANDNGALDAGETTFDGTDAHPGAIKLKRGTYVFRSTAPSDWHFTSQGGQRVVYVVSQSGQQTPVLFAQRPEVFDRKLAGRVTYAPTSAQTSPDGVGKGVPGVRIYFDLVYPFGLYDSGDPYVLTDANGNYVFDHLPRCRVRRCRSRASTTITSRPSQATSTSSTTP